MLLLNSIYRASIQMLLQLVSIRNLQQDYFALVYALHLSSNTPFLDLFNYKITLLRMAGAHVVNNTDCRGIVYH